MNKDFSEFQKTFKKYQEKFGLMGYKVYFKHELLQDSFADIAVNQPDMVVTVRLDTSNKEREFRNISQSAKHEAIHLLTARLQALGTQRYVSQDEIFEATEELAFKLEQLIPDIKE